MEFLKRSFLQARVFLEQLSPSQRWLIASLIIILLLSGYLVLQYAAHPELVSITQFAPDRAAEAKSHLERRGIHVVIESGQLLVPYDRFNDALMILLQTNLMPADTSRAFDELIKSHSPWYSNEHNRRMFLIAKQQYTAAVISKIEGVQSADVVISMPEERGFGRTHQRPTASISLIMEGVRPVDKALVEAVAALVSGAVAEMTEQDVAVIDANNGRRHNVGDPEDVMVTEIYALLKQTERDYKAKIEDQFSHILGVKVAVKARLDRVKQIDKQTYEYGTEPMEQEFERTEDRTDQSEQGEPGARSNTGIAIDGGAGSIRKHQSEERRTSFREKPIVMKTRELKIGHGTRQVNVSIGVPRRWLLALFLEGKPENTPRPAADDDAFQQRVDQELAKIVKQVETLIRTEDQKGEVVAAMYHDTIMTAMAPTGQQARGMAAFMEWPWTKHIGLGLLAMISLALMFGMVRKATQQPPLPGVEHIAGVPPTLAEDIDLVGQAEESEPPMGGIEVEESDLRTRKIADQINEMVKASPQEAGALLHRWIRPVE